MNIKKHKIKISADKQNSGFVLDLRPELKENKRENYFFPATENFAENNHRKEEGQWRSEMKNKKSLFSWGTKKSTEKKNNNSIIPKEYLANLKPSKKRSKKLLQSLKKFFKIFSFKYFFKRPQTSFWRFGSKKYFSSRGRLNYPKKGRAILYFVLFLLILIIPFKLYSYYRLATDEKMKKSLIEYSFSGVEGFVSASNNFGSLDLAQAQQNFLQAGQSFLSLNTELQKIDEFVLLLASLSDNKELRLASESKKVAKIGVYLAGAGNNLSLAIDALLNSLTDDKSASDFSAFNNYSKRSLNDFKKANKYLNKINEKSLPEEYRQQFNDLKKTAKVLEKNMDDFIDMIPALEDFLGVKTDKKYLIVFQNNAELRASGGFIGSYALIDLKKGKIKNIEVPAGGSYDTEGGMRALIESPQPLHLVKANWYFWDANWWPDWRMSSRNLMWFLEKSGGPSVDGVISLTPDVLRDILEVSGPIDLSEKYGVVVDANNFYDVIQEIVEVIGQPEIFKDKELKTDILDRVDVDSLAKMLASSSEVVSSSTASSTEILARNEPKKIIGDLMDKIMHNFMNDFNRDKLLASLKILENNLSRKNILLYFSNKDLQKEVEARSWAGELKDAPLDYLLLVDTNIAGGKTSYYIKNDYKLKVDIKSDGSIINKITINKKHLGTKGDLFSGVRNVNWLRVYVPLGSTLISAQGFSQPDAKYFKEAEASSEKNEILEQSENRYELDSLSQTKIYQESNKTVFANWTMIDPGQSEIIEIEYKLPYNFYTLFADEAEKNWWQKLFPQEKTPKYSLLWQKQAGALEANMEFSFNSDLPWSIVWTYPNEAKVQHSKVGYQGVLNADKYSAIIFE